MSYKETQSDSFKIESYKYSNGNSCFLLVAGVNILINNKLRVCGLAEIPISNLDALAHPPGGRTPRDPAEVQGCGWRTAGHHNFWAVYAGCYQHLVALIIPEYFWPKKCITHWCHIVRSWASVLLFGCLCLGTQKQHRHCPSPRWKCLKKAKDVQRAKGSERSYINFIILHPVPTYTVVLHLVCNLESPAELLISDAQFPVLWEWRQYYPGKWTQGKGKVFFFFFWWVMR